MNAMLHRRWTPRLLWSLLSVLAVLATMGVLLFRHWCSRSEETVVSFGVEVRNRSAEAVRDVRVLLVAPFDVTSTQSVRSLDSSHPYRIVRDAGGNSLLEFKIAELEARGTRYVSLRTRLDVSKRPKWRTPGPTREDHLPERFVESDSDTVQSAARMLTHLDAAPGDVESVLRLVERLVPLASVTTDEGAAAALRRGQGSSFDRACVVAALFRAHHVPARVIGGFVLGEARGGTFRARDLRYWAEAFLDGEWWPADPEGAGESRRVALRRLSSGLEQELPPLGLRDFAWVPDEFRAWDE